MLARKKNIPSHTMRMLSRNVKNVPMTLSIGKNHILIKQPIIKFVTAADGIKSWTAKPGEILLKRPTHQKVKSKKLICVKHSNPISPF
jgi:hypothetical protein